ncbi:tyrosine-type recombinase/integrase [Shewanella xiamenensis]|uniref:tyrosine-type recombinase/integrase n=1 Tax=Shewanella xiamenensis TaxID=332186 RepID=UPI00313BC189
MNDKQIKAFIRSKTATRKLVDDGLYIRVQTEGKASWELRYTSNGKRRFMTLEGGQYPHMSLADARAVAAILKQSISKGGDPLAERAKIGQEKIQTVDDLFNDWFVDAKKRLKHSEIPLRIYTKEVQPYIGRLQIKDVTPLDIRNIIQKVAHSNRPTIANDTLLHCKKLFTHACKLGLKDGNPASHFKPADAGGVEKSRERALSVEELKQFFSVAKDNISSFGRDNYLASALLVCLGVRKGELLKLTWQEIDLNLKLWKLPQPRTKSSKAISIPLPDSVVEWFEELQIRACGSDYVFPNRKASKKPHVSGDTLNRAVASLFGHDSSKTRQPINRMGEIPYFTIHDFRRTCRSLLAKQGVPSHIAERCLNHKIKGVEGIYDRYDYFDERLDALNSVANLIAPIVNNY